MKKLLATLLIGAFAFSITACGTSKESDTKTADSEATTEISGLEDLEGKTIGVQTGTTGDLAVSDDKSLTNATVERFNSNFEAVQALMQGKVDAVVTDDQPAQIFVEENEGLKILDAEYVEEDYAICVSKDNEDLLNDINKAIKELKEEGTIDSIVDYYITKSEEATPYESPEDVEYNNGTLVMATNAGFLPYEYHDGDEIVGLDVDLAKAIADKLGKELQIEDMAFDSIISAVQSGKADIGVAGMSVTEDRLKSINFTESYYTGHQVVIVAD